MKAYLILEDGHVFEGESFGAVKEVISEFVFNTSMTGYVEVLTDPSYAGQSVVMTYPLIGNYGVPLDDQESAHPFVEGFVVNELSRLGSNFRMNMSLNDYMIENNIPGIQGVDTRAITKIIRNKGCMNGMITTKKYDIDEVIEKLFQNTERSTKRSRNPKPCAAAQSRHDQEDSCRNLQLHADWIQNNQENREYCKRRNGRQRRTGDQHFHTAAG
jgi:carbamoyl-phosphate synthase small subunit